MLAPGLLARACHSSNEERWFLLRVNPIGKDRPGGAVITHANITEHKERENAVRESDERFRSMFATAATGMAISSPRGRLLQVNAAYCRMLGYTEEELLGRNFASLTHPDDLALNLKLRDELLAGQRESLVLEKRYLNKNGDTVWTRHSVSATRGAGGEIVTLMTVAEDITEQKKAHESLVLFRALIDKSNDAIEVLEPETCRFLDANESAWLSLGYSREELLALSITDIDPDLTPALKERIGNALRTSGSITFESRHRRKDGSIFPVEVNLRRVHLLDTGYDVCVVRDITERRRTQAALDEIRSRHRALFDNMLEGYVYCRLLYDEQGQALDYIYLETNDAFGPQTGLGNVVGKRVSEVVPGMHQANPEQLEIYSRVAATGRPERFETYAKPMGIWFSVSVYSDEKDHFIAVFDNITERKRNEERLRKSEKLLAEAEALGHIGSWDRHLTSGQGTRSDEFYRILGLDPKVDAGGLLDYEKLLYPEDIAHFLEIRQAVLLGQEARAWEFRIIHPDRGVRDMHVRVGFERDEEGRAVRIYGTIKDITEQKQAEKSLVASELKYRQLISALPAAVYTCDAQGRITLFNDAAVKLRGGAPEIGSDQWSGGWRLYAPDGSPLPFADSPMAMAIREERSIRGFEIIIERPDGSRSYVLPHVDLLRNAAGLVVGAVNMLIDLTERRRSDEALRQSREELRALARRVEFVREEQAVRIARELHDVLGQALTMLKLQVRSLQRRLEQRTGEPTTFESRDALELIDGAFRNVRELCAELRPPVLDHLGLGPVIETLAAQFRTHSGIACAVSGAADLPPMEMQGQLAAYRIVQELLTNVARHAEATEARIALRVEGGTLEIEVADNGRGIRTAEVTGIRSLGLLGMRERALAAGGSITIEGRIGGGTIGMARIPIGQPGKSS